MIFQKKKKTTFPLDLEGLNLIGPRYTKKKVKKKAFNYKASNNMKTGFTVDTQRGDIEPDFVEGGGSR